MFVNKHSNNWSNMPNQLVNINASLSFSNSSSSSCCNCSRSGRSRRRRSSSSDSSILDFVYTNSIATSSRD